MTSIRLKPGLDPRKYAEAYRQSKLVQIPDFLEAGVADALERSFASLPWQLVCQNDDGQNILFSRQDWAALPQERRAEIAKGMNDRAARNLGFMYLTFPMIEAYLQRQIPEHPIHALTEFFNSPAFISFAGAVIGYPQLTKVSAHATSYAAGHYLTRHSDTGEMYERRAAYTLGFSRVWEPDWGGLLVFLDEDMNIRRGFVPRFNTLTIFDGVMVHAVTAVAPFAPRPRLTVTGWFRDDPPVS